MSQALHSGPVGSGSLWEPLADVHGYDAAATVPSHDTSFDAHDEARTEGLAFVSDSLHQLLGAH